MGAEANRAFRTHAYDLASFGLDAGAVRERFADYTEAFAVPTDEGRGNGRGE